MDLFNQYDMKQYKKYIPENNPIFLIDNPYEIIPGGRGAAHNQSNLNWEYTSCAIQYIDKNTCRAVFRIMVDFQELRPNDQFVIKIYEKDSRYISSNTHGALGNLEKFIMHNVVLDESCFDYKTDVESILPCRQETIINTPFALYVRDHLSKTSAQQTEGLTVPKAEQWDHLSKTSAQQTKGLTVPTSNNTIISTKIPRTIVQTALKSTMHFHMFSSCLSHIDLNPSFQYIFFDEQDVLNFIEKNFSQEIFRIYKLIIPGAFRADFFRYLYLYKHGGFYLDCKSISKVSLMELVDGEDEFIFCKDRNYRAIYNAVLFSVPEHHVIMRAISEIMHRVDLLHKNKDDQRKINELLCRYGIYGITGPVLLYDVIYNHRESRELSPKLIFSKYTNQIHCRKYKHKIYLINPMYWSKETHFDKVCFVPFYPSYYKNYKSIYSNNLYYKEQYIDRKLVY